MSTNGEGRALSIVRPSTGAERRQARRVLDEGGGGAHVEIDPGAEVDVYRVWIQAWVRLPIPPTIADPERI